MPINVDILEEKDTFLERKELLKLAKANIGHLNRLVTREEIKLVI